MRIPSLLIVFALLGSSAWAQHDDSYYYVQLGLGGVFSEEADAPNGKGDTISFDPGVSASLAFGRSFRLSERFSVAAELEGFYQYFTVDEDELDGVKLPRGAADDAKTLAYLVNGLVEWHFTPQFGLYGGLGLGWAKEVDYSGWDSGGATGPNTADEDGVAFQGRLGLDFNLGGSYDFRFGYRFFKTSVIDVQDSSTTPIVNSEIDVAQHSLELCFRWGL